MSQRNIGNSTAKPSLEHDRKAEARSGTVPTEKLQKRFAACLQSSSVNKAVALKLPYGEDELDQLEDADQLTFMVGSVSPWMMPSATGNNGGYNDSGASKGDYAGGIAGTPFASELPLKNMRLLELPAALLSPGGEYNDGMVALSRGDGIQLAYTILNGPASGMTILASLAAGNNLRLQMIVRERSDYDYLKTRHDKLMAALSGCRYNVVLDIRHVASAT